MIDFRQGVDLRPYNTFRISVACDLFCEIGSEEGFRELLATDIYKTAGRLVLGGGSNVLFTGDFKGLVIRNSFRGIQTVREEGDAVYVKAAAGEVWHEFVLYTIRQGLGGLENLSLIPGCVGASPMQNIGAYGVEIKDVFHELEAYSMETGLKRVFSKKECEFGYRESVFKRALRDKYLIASVTYRLSKKPSVNTSYGAIVSELQAMGISEPGIRDVSEAVIRIRRSKLPDPDVTGNAGSFFKNPEVSAAKHAELTSEFPGMVAYRTENGFKLAAGWLIEQCGLKGTELNGAAVHDRQALVIVNRSGTCSGADVYRLSQLVKDKVSEKFGVDLEREVNIVP